MWACLCGGDSRLILEITLNASSTLFIEEEALHQTRSSKVRLLLLGIPF